MIVEDGTSRMTCTSGVVHSITPSLHCFMCMPAWCFEVWQPRESTARFVVTVSPPRAASIVWSISDW